MLKHHSFYKPKFQENIYSVYSKRFALTALKHLLWSWDTSSFTIININKCANKIIDVYYKTYTTKAEKKKK